MESSTANPFWTALTTNHASLALGDGPARRYPADGLPMGAVAEPGPDAFQALFNLLAPGEAIYVTGELTDVRPLQSAAVLPCLQMEFPPEGVQPLREKDVLLARRLGENDAAAMVHLTDVAFPGFFRPRTYLLGSYFGVEANGELIGMAGERAAFPGYREISAVCTHPEHTGKGLASLLLHRLLAEHASAGDRSILHVAVANTRAIALYRRLGFEQTRELRFNRLQRTTG